MGDRFGDVRTVTPHRVDPRPDRVGDDDLRRLDRDLGLGRYSRGGRRARADLDEERGDAAGDPVGDRAVVDVLGGGPRMERHRGVLERLRAETFHECAGREDEGVTGLDTLTPHVGQHVGNPSERCRLPRRRSVHEVRKLAGLFARQEQSRAPNEKDLSGTDPRGVQLVVDHHRARAMKRDPTALVTQPLRRATVRLPQGFAQRDFDASREVVVVLLPREICDLAREIGRGIRPVLARDLAEEIKTPLRAQRRTQGRLAGEDDVGSPGANVRGAPQLRDEARLPHPGRVYGAERPAGTERIFAIPLRGAAFTIASTSSRSRSRISVAQ